MPYIVLDKLIVEALLARAGLTSNLGSEVIGP